PVLVFYPPVRYVPAEPPSQGEPLFIASLLISVECHLPDTCGPAALAKVVPESWVQPRGQAAGANRLAAGLRILGPARLRLDLVELLEQPQGPGRAMAPSVTDRSLRAGQRNSLRHCQCPVGLRSQLDEPPRGGNGDVEQVCPAELASGNGESIADSGQAVREVGLEDPLVPVRIPL